MNEGQNDNDVLSERNAKIVYYLYIASMIIGITAIIGLIMAYVNIKDAPEWVKTHYRLQIRTFWIGFLYSIISGLFVHFFIGYFMLLFVIIWFLVRCIKGLNYLDKKQPYPNPATWLF